MKKLWVLRHAKAAPHSDDDHSRPLAARGRRQCAELATHLDEAGRDRTEPQLVLCSSAVRAVETAVLVLAGLGARPGLEAEPGLYLADADLVVDRLRRLDDELVAVMIVGHNPTLHDLIVLLLEPADEVGRRRLDDGFPTAALAVVEVPVDRWAAVAQGTGRLQSWFVPAR
ncbi:MAG: SixA phosphatase family protein [Acidimicrobiales bacterium]